MQAEIRSGRYILDANIEHSTSEQVGLALVLPGFLDSCKYPHLTSLCVELAKIGYTAASFDSRGTWNSTGELSDYTISCYLDDTHEVRHHLEKEGKSRLVICGHSLGAMVAILYSSLQLDISATVAIMPPRHFLQWAPDDLETWKENGHRVSIKDVPNCSDRKRTFRVPFSPIVADAQQYNAVEAVKNIHAPILFIAGRQDTKIPPSSVAEIHERANKPKTMVTLSVDHDYRTEPNRVSLVNSVVTSFIGTGQESSFVDFLACLPARIQRHNTGNVSNLVINTLVPIQFLLRGGKLTLPEARTIVTEFNNQTKLNVQLQGSAGNTRLKY